MRSPRRGGGAAVVLAALLLGLGAAVAVACDDSGSSTGTTTAPGDTVINDTRDAETRATPNPDPGDGSTPMGQPDGYATGQPEEEGGYGGYGDDAPSVTYPGASECSSCSCPAATAYCFGGAPPRPEPMSVTVQAGTTDAGPACPLVAAGTVGCTSLTAGLTDCVSLLNALQPSYGCTLNCSFDGKTMTVYCPAP